MAVDVAQIGVVYDALEVKAVGTMQKLFDANTIESKYKADVISKTINSILQISAGVVQDQPVKDAQVTQSSAQTEAINSEKAIKEAQSAKDLLIKDAQVTQSSAQTEAINSEKAIKEAQSAKDLLIKDAQKDIFLQQKLSEVQRTAQLTQIISEATAKQAYNVANVQKQGNILDKQSTKLDKDILMVDAQTAAITQQVIDNRQIKIMASLGDTYSTMAANQLTVNADMWTFFFNIIHKLDSTISIPASMAITKVT